MKARASYDYNAKTLFVVQCGERRFLLDERPGGVWDNPPVQVQYDPENGPSALETVEE